MGNDVYIIFITAFAIFGVYCAIDTLYKLFTVERFSKSVIFVLDNDKYKSLRTVKFIEQTVPNCYVAVYSEDFDPKEYIKNISLINSKK